jgi:hypothetical protein
MGTALLRAKKIADDFARAVIAATRAVIAATRAVIAATRDVRLP